MVKIALLTRASEERLKDLNRVLSQLRKENSGSLDELTQLVASKDIVMVVAVLGERIVGVATLFVLRKIGKRIGYIEDVVVDREFRGHGLGEKIMKRLISEARARKVTYVSLTSRPSRVAAVKLYKKLGFARAETNVYRIKF